MPYILHHLPKPICWFRSKDELLLDFDIAWFVYVVHPVLLVQFAEITYY